MSSSIATTPLPHNFGKGGPDEGVPTPSEAPSQLSSKRFRGDRTSSRRAGNPKGPVKSFDLPWAFLVPSILVSAVVLLLLMLYWPVIITMATQWHSLTEIVASSVIDSSVPEYLPSFTVIPLSAPESTLMSGNFRIPKVIHQAWISPSEERGNSNATAIGPPQEWAAAVESCRRLHPDWDYKLWTTEPARDLVADYYPQLLQNYDSYRFAIQRADAIRYMVLHHFGGVYLDMDIECKHNLDFLRAYDFVIPQTWPTGFGNDFIMAAPGHSFLTQLVEALPKWNIELLMKYPTVMFSTGPQFATLQALLYPNKKGIAVLPPSLYGKHANDTPAIFHHLNGSSWHADDAVFVVWIGNHPALFALLLLSLVVFSARVGAFCDTGTRLRTVCGFLWCRAFRRSIPYTLLRRKDTLATVELSRMATSASDHSAPALPDTEGGVSSPKADYVEGNTPDNTTRSSSSSSSCLIQMIRRNPESVAISINPSNSVCAPNSRGIAVDGSLSTSANAVNGGIESGDESSDAQVNSGADSNNSDCGHGMATIAGKTLLAVVPRRILAKFPR